MSSHGGKRIGAGRKPTWKKGQCKAIKVPVALADEVMRYARLLDEDEAPLILKPNQPVDEKAGRWEQVKQLIDEKQELAKRLEGVKAALEKEKKARGMLETRLTRLEAQNADAASILRDGFMEYKKGIRKTFRVADVRSAMLALGHDADSIK